MQKIKFKQTELGLIPEDWEVYKFSDVIEINPKRELEKGTETKFVSMQDLKEFNKKIHGYVMKKFEGGGSKFINNDTLMARITPCLENGKTAFVNILDNKEVGFGSTEFIVLSGKNGRTTDDFVYYFSISPQLRAKAIQSMTGTSGRQRVQTNLLGDIEIGIPSIIEQKYISKILSDFDSKIELNNQINQNLEEIGKAVFKHWFTDFEFPNEEGKPYKSSGGEMVDSEFGKIPVGWRIGRIEELCSSITSGGTPIRMENKYWNGNIPWFKTGELNDRPLIESEECITKEGLENSACKLWEPNTILIALYASPTVGRLGLLKVRGTSNQACCGLVAKEVIGYPFLFYTLFFKRNEFNSIAVGAAQQNINQKVVRETKIIVPDTEILDRFSRLVKPLFERQTNLSIESKCISKIRDSILPKLISGKIRVPVEVKK